MDKDPVHHRPELARRLAATLLGHDPLSAAGRSGLFLSAPLRKAVRDYRQETANHRVSPPSVHDRQMSSLHSFYSPIGRGRIDPGHPTALLPSLL